ncbi:MAG: hypothetical protein WBQ40_04290 [Candidatus Sulfotelmatobacter sp.]
MSLFKRKQLPHIKPVAPAPDPLIVAERELDVATALCLSLDQERRDWAAKRENANRRFNDALAHYHAALDQAERTA